MVAIVFGLFRYTKTDIILAKAFHIITKKKWDSHHKITNNSPLVFGAAYQITSNNDISHCQTIEKLIRNQQMGVHPEVYDQMDRFVMNSNQQLIFSDPQYRFFRIEIIVCKLAGHLGFWQTFYAIDHYSNLHSNSKLKYRISNQSHRK